MRAVIQRVASARVTVDGRETGSIGFGALVFVGVTQEDTDQEAQWLADKVANIRIFSDDEGRMNRSLLDIAGKALVVSQFTLYGDARKGRRPSFIRAQRGSEAERLYEMVISELERRGVPTASGEFGAMMLVDLMNEGPVTLLLDSERQF
jgi:D-aminoacyl-tRNA deacylase